MNLTPARRQTITAGLLLGMALGALEATVVGTASRRVVAISRRLPLQLGLSASSLTSTASVPLGRCGIFMSAKGLPCRVFLLSRRVVARGQRSRGCSSSSFGPFRGSSPARGAAGDDNHRGSTRSRTAASAALFQRHVVAVQGCPLLGLPDRCHIWRWVFYSPAVRISDLYRHWVGLSAFRETVVSRSTGRRALPLPASLVCLRDSPTWDRMRCWPRPQVLDSIRVGERRTPNRSCAHSGRGTDVRGRFPSCSLGMGMFRRVAFLHCSSRGRWVARPRSR